MLEFGKLIVELFETYFYTTCTEPSEWRSDTRLRGFEHLAWSLEIISDYFKGL